MNLETMEDLVENKLVIRPDKSTITGSILKYDQYASDGFWIVQWYQPHNPRGTSDSRTFKRFAYEMLGYGGYEGGLIEWGAYKNDNDVEALQTITKDPNNTMNLKKIYYATLKRATNEFTNGNVYEISKAIEVRTAQELIDALSKDEPVYVKLMDHIDFTGIEDPNGYYIKNFSGNFDGNNFEMYGHEYPLFQTVTFANFKNMYFDVTNIERGRAVVAQTSNNVIIDGIHFDRTKKLRVITQTNNIYELHNITGMLENYISPRK